LTPEQHGRLISGHSEALGGWALTPPGPWLSLRPTKWVDSMRISSVFSVDHAGNQFCPEGARD